MKKFIIVFLSFIAMLCCALMVAACNLGSSNSQGGNDNRDDNTNITTPLPDEKPDEKPADSHTHELTHIPANPADCETDGNIEYYTCTCGKWFSDANATNEIIDKSSVVLKALGHSYSEKWTYNEMQHWHKATCGHSDLTTTPQNHTFENNVCTVCKYINDLLLFKTLEVNDDSVYGKVSNDTTDFSFIKEVQSNDNVIYTVCTDKACKEVIPSKTVDLQIGDNVYYVLATRGNDLKLYTVTIRRRPIYIITFDTNGGNDIEGQHIEEDSTVTEQTTAKPGYTCTGWTVEGANVAFPYTITENTTFVAIFTANTYTVTLDVNGGDELEQIEFTATYDSLFTFVTPMRTGYSFVGWYDGETEVFNCEWKYTESKTFTAKWRVNAYQIILNKNYSNAGTVSGAGDHDYRERVTLSATTYLGYTWLGWYNSDNVLLTSELSYTLVMPAKNLTYSPKWELREDIINFNFTSTETALTITGIKDKTVTAIFVPDYVTGISSGVFSGCSRLESITVPFVGDSAKTENDTYQYPFGYIFGTSSYTGGTAIKQYYHVNSTGGTMYSTYYIPETLKSVTVTGGNILYGAFYGCSELTYIAVPDDLTAIGGSAFYNCSGLTSLTIGNSVTSIGSSVFYGCSGLTSITIPDSVTSIGSSAFYSCSGLTKITVDNGNKIYHSAGNCLIETESKILILGCKNSIIPADDSVTKIGSGAFYNCAELTSVIIPDGVTYIGSSAFYKCSGLTSITIPDNVTSIESSVFYYCSGLASVTIPDSVTSIGSSAFYNCTSLTKIIIPDSVASIGNRAFEDCTSLADVTIGNGVISIGDYAIYGCSRLKSVTIPASVTNIGDSNFRSLETVYWNATNCTKVGTSGFYIFGSALKNVMIGENVKYIPSYAFYECTGLCAVHITDIAKWCKISFGASYANPLYYAHKLYLNNELVTELIVPDGVTSIGRNAFDNCSSITSITISSGVTYISDSAFSNCRNLDSVYWNATSCIVSSDYPIFYGCSALKTAIIGENVQTVPSYVFYGRTSLTSVKIGNSVTSIGNYAFRYCSALTSITIPDSVTSIGERAFCECSGLTSVAIGNKVMTIGKDAFLNCVNLTVITIPDSVTSIGDSAFFGCSKLRVVTIGNGVTSIGSGAFSSCTELSRITIGSSVNHIGIGAFYDCAKLTTVLHVASEYSEMIIAINNSYYTDAKHYYYSEEKPEGSGNFWYYNENNQIAFW